MNFQAPERGRAYGSAPHLYQQQLRAMHHVMQMTSNAGFAGSPSDGVMQLGTETHDHSPSQYQSMYDAHNASSHSPMGYSTPYSYPPNEKTSPQSSITTSSSTASPYDDYQEDAMVDAAMMESGILTAAPMVEDDHFGLDAALLREMEDLLAYSREDAAQWNQFHLESPSLVFPQQTMPTVAPATPDSVWSGANASPAHSHPSRSPAAPAFVPEGAGWEVPRQEARGEQAEEDIDMDSETEEPPPESAADVREKELLDRQLKFLEAQRDFLAYKTAMAKSAEDAMPAEEVENKKKAEDEKEQLTAAELQHKMLANVAREQRENLKYMELLLLQSPLNHYRMTLMTPMESFIHLTKDPVQRRATLETLRDNKIDDVMRYINYQSRNIDVERQFFYLDTFEKFGKFYTVDFSISKLDDTSVDEVVHIIYHHFASTNDVISEILGSVENREYFDGIEGYFLHARFVDRITLPSRPKGGRRFVVQESNTVYFIKKIGETVIMACDYIDKDELHPYRNTGRIRKDTTVGVIVEPYTDSNGKKCVIMKRFSFIKHHFKNIPPTPDLVQAISTKVILWGQAVRFCLAGHVKAKAKKAQVSKVLLAKAAEVSKLLGPEDGRKGPDPSTWNTTTVRQ